MNTCAITRHINYKDIPVNLIPISEAGATSFNAIVTAVHAVGMNKIRRAPSGGLSYNIRDFSPPMYDIRALGSCIELTVVAASGCFRVQFRNDFRAEEKDKYSGSTAWRIFTRELEHDGINIENYAILNGADIKSTIPSPKLSLEVAPGIYENANHLDIHSAYMASVADAFPELRPTIKRVFDARKYNPGMKAVLTHSFGYMQSAMLDYKFSHLSKAAIVGTINKLNSLSEALRLTNRRILAYNTDGIWYTGEIFHGDGEGRDLGEWSNDHVNCTIKFNSIGTYGYIEDGTFTPVVRALRALDKVKPRDQWTMDDLDHLGESIDFVLDLKNEKIIKVVDDA